MVRIVSWWWPGTRPAGGTPQASHATRWACCSPAAQHRPAPAPPRPPWPGSAGSRSGAPPAPAAAPRPPPPRARAPPRCPAAAPPCATRCGAHCIGGRGGAALSAPQQAQHRSALVPALTRVPVRPSETGRTNCLMCHASAAPEHQVQLRRQLLADLAAGAELHQRRLQLLAQVRPPRAPPRRARHAGRVDTRLRASTQAACGAECLGFHAPAECHAAAAAVTCCARRYEV